MPELMIFGSTGTLGKATLEKFEAQGWNITCGVRKVVNSCDVQLPFDIHTVPAGLEGKSFDAVVFAQGANLNGSVMENPRQQLEELFEANVTMIAETIAAMMKHDLIAQGGRVVIISSLWEQLTRQEKFAYSVTKAAVGGLVRSLAVDLGRAKGILVNAILPGIVMSPMVERTLSPQQIANVVGQTPGGKLATPVDVANAIYLLGCETNTAISGQSVFVDQGFSIARTI
jgi:3-oxoacyl-[acyl-carrier protein] reductase